MATEKTADPLERVIPDTIGVLDRATGRFHPHAPVGRITTHPPGQHPEKSPILPTLTAVKIETAVGVRWFGFERAWIGADLRMHVAPINPRDTVVARWPLPTGAACAAGDGGAPWPAMPWDIDAAAHLRAVNAIHAFLRARDLAHDVTFYTREQWAARGENLCDGARFTMVAEGAFNHAWNYPGSDADVHMARAFIALVDSLGFWYEQGFAWSWHFYPVDAGQETRPAPVVKHGRDCHITDPNPHYHGCTCGALDAKKD